VGADVVGALAGDAVGTKVGLVVRISVGSALGPLDGIRVGPLLSGAKVGNSVWTGGKRVGALVVGDPVVGWSVVGIEVVGASLDGGTAGCSVKGFSLGATVGLVVGSREGLEVEGLFDSIDLVGRKVGSGVTNVGNSVSSLVGWSVIGASLGSGDGMDTGMPVLGSKVGKPVAGPDGFFVGFTDFVDLALLLFALLDESSLEALEERSLLLFFFISLLPFDPLSLVALELFVEEYPPTAGLTTFTDFLALRSVWDLGSLLL